MYYVLFVKFVPKRKFKIIDIVVKSSKDNIF
jgi:hypothetical protein